MAQVIRTETRRRGFFGKLFKWTFIIFNIAMVLWLVSYWGNIARLSEGLTSNAEKAGTVIGATAGTGVLVFVWAAGDIILGLFVLLTRGKTVIVEETVA